MFNFEIEVKFKAIKVGEEEPWTEGKIKIHEFFSDDDDVELTITIDKSSDNVPGTFLEKVKQSINGSFRSKVVGMIDNFKMEFKQREADAKIVQEDKKKRAEEEEQMKVALEKSGDIKAKIFEEQKQKEQEMKLQEQMKAAS